MLFPYYWLQEAWGIRIESAGVACHVGSDGRGIWERREYIFFVLLISACVPLNDDKILKKTNKWRQINGVTFSCPWPIARNFNLFPPKPDLSASFIKSLAGSEPGLRMKIIGENGLDCSNIASKLITGGVTYFSLILPVTKFVMAR